MKDLIKTEIIESYITDNHISKTQFCKMCNISLSTLKKIFTNKDIRLNALFKIAKVIGIKVYQLFN